MYALFNLHKNRIGLNAVQAVNLGFPLVFFPLSALWFGTKPAIEIDASRMKIPLSLIDIIPETRVFISDGRLSSLFFGYVACLFVSLPFFLGAARWAFREKIEPGARLVVSPRLSGMLAVLLIALSALVYLMPFTEMRTASVGNIGLWYLFATWSFALPSMFVPDAVLLTRAARRMRTKAN